MKTNEIINMVKHISQLRGLTKKETIGILLIQELQELNEILINSTIGR